MPTGCDPTPMRNAQHFITTTTAYNYSTPKVREHRLLYESNALMVIMIDDASRIDDETIAIDPNTNRLDKPVLDLHGAFDHSPHSWRSLNTTEPTSRWKHAK